MRNKWAKVVRIKIDQNERPEKYKLHKCPTHKRKRERERKTFKNQICKIFINSIFHHNNWEWIAPFRFHRLQKLIQTRMHFTCFVRLVWHSKKKICLWHSFFSVCTNSLNIYRSKITLKINRDWTENNNSYLWCWFQDGREKCAQIITSLTCSSWNWYWFIFISEQS